MNKRIIIYGCYFLALIFGLFLFYKFEVTSIGERNKPILVNTAQLRENTQWLMAGDVLEQTVEFTDTHLNSFTLWFDATNLTEDTKIKVVIKEQDSGREIQSWQKVLQRSGEDGGIGFDFEESYVIDAKTTLVVQLIMDENLNSDELAVKQSNWDAYADGELTINGQGGDQDLVFWFYSGPAVFVKFLYFVLAAVLMIGLGVLLYIMKQKQVRPERVFLCIGTVLGAVYMIIWSPLSAPDEVKHYATAYYYSNILMGEEGANEEGYVMVREDDIKYNNQEEFTRLSTYAIIADHLFETCQSSTLAAYDQYPLDAPFYAYIPHILGITLARLMGVGVVALMLMGRGFGLIFYLLIGYFIIKKSSCLKWTLLMFMLLPGMLQIGASFSYDMVMNLALLLYFSYLAHLIYEKDQMSVRDIVILSALLLIAAPIKVIYSLLGILVFTVPKEKRSHMKGSFVSFIPALIGLLSSFGARFLSISSFLARNYQVENANRWSLGMVFQKPIRCIYLALNTIVEYLEQWMKEIIYAFPEYSGIIFAGGIVIGFWVLLIISNLLDGRRKEVNLTQKKIIIAAAVITLGAFLGVFLLAELTTVDSKVIGGIQGRYFWPLIPWLFLLYNPKKEYRIDKGVIMTMFWFLHCSIILEVFKTVIGR